MNKTLMITGLLLALSALQPTASQATPLAQCETGSWTITLNDNDQSAKEDFLALIDLLGENGGFQITGVISFASSVGGRFLFIHFNSSYYQDPRHAARVKRSVLEAITELRGMIVSCDPVITLPGGVTGSN